SRRERLVSREHRRIRPPRRRGRLSCEPLQSERPHGGGASGLRLPQRQSAAITVQESVLQVPEGRSLSLVGGNVSIVGGLPGLVRARSGRVSVISVASPGEVSFDAATQTPDISAGSFTRLGTIELSDQAFLDTTGAEGSPGSGTIAIRGGRLVIRNSDLLGNSNGDVDGARVGIDVRVTEAVILDNSRM